MLKTPICFFDLETTGKSVTKDKIVSISIKKLGPDLKEIAPPLYYVINPGVPIPAEATAVHKITDEMVKDAPKFSEVSQIIFDYMQGCILGGFNVKSYDIPLLSEEFSRGNTIWPERDIVIIDCYKIFSFKEERNLTQAYRFYTGNELVGAHNAEDDNQATVDVFAGQLSKYADIAGMDETALDLFCSGGVKTLDLAGKLFLNAAGIACYNFGKAKNTPVVNDRGFGEWMLKNEFPANTKNIVKGLLYPKK